MCNAVAFIFRKDGQVFFPAPNTWNHSHRSIAEYHKLPAGLIGDALARCELTPKPEKNGEIRWHEANGRLRDDVETWVFTLDEQRAPAWWAEDAAAWEDRARKAVKRWLATAPGHLAPGAVVTAGYGGTATAGNSGTATAGNWGTATAGYGGTATAGNSGTATAGNRGTATAGYWGTATAGYGGTATAGKMGIISIRHWDGKRYRLIVGYVGEDGIEANTPYRVEGGKLVEAKPAATPAKKPASKKKATAKRKAKR